MARYELLNNISHKDLRVATGFGSEFGDNVAILPAFPSEYADLQREYPIFLRKDNNSGEFHSVVLLGFEENENLYLQDGRWNAQYLPGAVARGPFLIGFQGQHIDGELRREAVIHVDVEHPRITSGQGLSVFLPQGGQSPYLDHIITVLRGIHNGNEFANAMCSAFEKLALIQPIQLEVQWDQSHRANLTGLYNIDRERLRALDAAALHGLHQAGYLEGAFLLLASTQNVRRLIAEKQRRMQQTTEIAIKNTEQAR